MCGVVLGMNHKKSLDPDSRQVLWKHNTLAAGKLLFVETGKNKLFISRHG